VATGRVELVAVANKWPISDVIAASVTILCRPRKHRDPPVPVKIVLSFGAPTAPAIPFVLTYRCILLEMDMCEYLLDRKEFGQLPLFRYSSS